ncbi:MAG: NAD(P)/FAD-dependent oxidoreductase [Patescibacteria group bacterium]
MDSYDIIIIGGGPAGATAGFALAKSGKRVLIIDKEVFPREKLCGGMITEKCIKILNEVYGDLELEKIIDSKNNCYEIYKKDGSRLNECISATRNLYFVNRIEFDAYLFNKALSAGCAYKQDRVVKVENKKVFLASGLTLESEFIIGADGANSVVRKFVSNKVRAKKTLALEIEADYQDIVCLKDGIFPQLYFGFINCGYAWVFPKKNKASIGIGGIIGKNEADMGKLFADFLTLVLGAKADKYKSEIKGFPVPMHNLLRKPVKDNVLLIGDAAGLVDPITGEGIHYAVFSGLAVARCILGNNTKENYEKYFYKNFYREFVIADIFKRIFFYRTLHPYFLKKIGEGKKYVNLCFDLISGEFEYSKLLRKILTKQK